MDSKKRKKSADDFGQKWLLILKDKVDVSKLKILLDQKFQSVEDCDKGIIIEFLISSFRDNRSGIRKRIAEIFNDEEDYIKKATSFFNVLGVCFPLHLMEKVIDYLYFNMELLLSLGSTNSSFYLLLLTHWPLPIHITKEGIFDVPRIVLKTMKRCVIRGGLTENENLYLTNHMDVGVLEIIFHHDMCLEDVNDFFETLRRKNVVLRNCTRLFFPTFYHSTNQQKMINFPLKSFPNLHTIDNFQPDTMNNPPMLEVMKSLVFGCRFDNCWLSKWFGVEWYKTDYNFSLHSDFNNTDFFTGLGYNGNQNQIKPKKMHNLLHMLQTSKVITKRLRWVKFRINDFGDYHFLINSSEYIPSTIERFELIVKVRYSKEHLRSINHPQPGLFHSCDVSDEDFIHLHFNSKLKFIEKFQNLKYLHVQVLCGPVSLNPLEDTFQFGHKNVRVLKLIDIPFLMCESVFQNFPNLEVFDILFTSGKQTYGRGIDFESSHREVQESFFEKFFDHQNKLEKMKILMRDALMIELVREKILRFHVYGDNSDFNVENWFNGKKLDLIVNCIRKRCLEVHCPQYRVFEAVFRENFFKQKKFFSTTEMENQVLSKDYQLEFCSKSETDNRMIRRMNILGIKKLVTYSFVFVRNF